MFKSASTEATKQFESGLKFPKRAEYLFLVKLTMRRSGWVNNTAKHFPQENIVFSFHKTRLFFALYLAELPRGAAVWRPSPPLKQGARLRYRSHLEHSQNSSAVRCALPPAAAPNSYASGIFFFSSWLSKSLVWTLSYLGGVASVQGVFGHEGLQSGEGQVSQVLLVLQRQAQLTQQQPRQEVLPAELPGQVVLRHRGCTRTQGGIPFKILNGAVQTWNWCRISVQYQPKSVFALNVTSSEIT